MNSIEILSALEDLACSPFATADDIAEFPYAFLRCFGANDTTIKKLRKGDTNKSDMGGVLQRLNAHIVVCAKAEIDATLDALRDSPATKKYKVKYIVATDGEVLRCEYLHGAGDILVCALCDIADNFGFFMPLGGLSRVDDIGDNPLDMKATVRLNRLYTELLKTNPTWGDGDGIQHMNHFMAQLIFCFFAEDTNIFSKGDFTATVKNFAHKDSTNTHTIITEIFRAMNVPSDKRDGANIPRYANGFPYVNGGLFGGDIRVPVFSALAQSRLEYIGGLDWQGINPDIFGSMIQSITDADERSHIGMHYTSVPNILKLLKPLFLDDLWDGLYEAGDNARKLLNLRNRIHKIRVFDPACGSGNFLVIAYKELRKLEYEINKKRGEGDRDSGIPIDNFRGIELRAFSTEIARLALIIAEYQCNVTYLGEGLALNAFLPLKKDNWITCGNALRLDWLSICPPTGHTVKLVADDLLNIPLDQAEIDFKNQGGETYIVGNPPYLGSSMQSKQQKSDMDAVFSKHSKTYRALDYVSAWFMKASEYARHTPTKTAFVSTNSICQGVQVASLWKPIFGLGQHIIFAYTSFKWKNLASHNAGVTVAIIGISNIPTPKKRLFSITESGDMIEQQTDSINGYLLSGGDVIIEKQSDSICNLPKMLRGSISIDGRHLFFNKTELDTSDLTPENIKKFIRPAYGSDEFIKGTIKYCLWIPDDKKDQALAIPTIKKRVEKVKEIRLQSTKKQTQKDSQYSYKFAEIRQKGTESIIVIPCITSENREYLPCGILPSGSIITGKNFGLFDAPLWCMALIVSKMHYAWADKICSKFGTGFSYSNTLGWNTFPVPKLTTDDTDALTESAETILLTREYHFPKTIADLYDPKTMPDDLKHAHIHNDQIVDRIFAGKDFANNTDRLNHLFKQYTTLINKTKA